MLRPREALFTCLVVLGVASGGPAAAGYIDPQGNQWRSLTDTTRFSWNDIDSVCPNDGASACSGAIDGYDFSGLIWATHEQVRSLISGFGVNIPLQGNIGEIDSLWAPAFQAAFGVTGTTGTFSVDSRGWTSTTGPFDTTALMAEIWNRGAGFFDVAGFSASA